MIDTPDRPFNQIIRINTLRLGAVLLVPLLLFVRPYFSEEGLVVEVSELLGTFLIIACVLGRFWSTLYIGSRKNKGIVTDGPYSTTSNPLYFFSTLGAFGVGLLFGKLSLALLIGVAVFLVLYATARREQAFLEAIFGPNYRAYAARVPMFIPDPRLFRTEPSLVISAGALRRNLFDAFVFMSAFPLAELAEALVNHVGYSAMVLP
jgi:protein-S-isoprenylcysteine O-methyltransferase Ste14